MIRFRKYIESKGLWNADKEAAYKKEARSNVLKSFAAAEKRKKPSVQHLFTEVYDSLPPHLVEQQAELKRLMEKYPTHYDTSAHA